MDAKLTSGPWVAVINERDESGKTHHCCIGLALRPYPSSFAAGTRPLPADPCAPIDAEYLLLSGYCRPADAAAMAAAGEMLQAALKLQARGFFAASSCADDETNLDMAAMRAAITKATTIPAVSASTASPGGAA